MLDSSTGYVVSLVIHEDYRQMYATWYAARQYLDGYKGYRRPTMLGAHDIIRYFEHTHVQVKATIQDCKDLHTLRWQTKDGIYRLKQPVQAGHLPDVRDQQDEGAPMEG